MRFVRVSMIALVLTGTVACGSDTEPSDTEPTDTEPSDTTSDVGIANPASEFCLAQGGTVDIVDEAGGQTGYCNLPDGTRVEEWEYFRSQDPAPTTQP